MRTYQLQDFANPISVAVTNPSQSGYSRFVGLEHYDSGELVVKRYSGTELLTTTAKAFETNDILIARRNVYLKRAGIVFFDGITSGDTIVLRIKNDCESATGVPKDLAQRIIPIVLNSEHFWIYANKHADGMNSKRISKEMLLTYEFELPSLEEQRVLADKLWAAYEVKESYKNLLAQTDKLLHAQFQKMFGAETNTPHEKLEKLCKTFIDGDWIESKDQSTEGVRLVQTGNVGNGEYLDKLDKAHHITESTFERLHCTEIFAGDILISRLPDPIGRACIIPKGLGKAITAVDCTIIRLKENRILPKYFIAATNSTAYQDKVRSFITGTTRARISRGNLATIEIPVPPIEQQNKFATVAEQAERTKASLNKGIEAIEAVIRSLIAEGTTKV